jgi:branched-subunit amino acid aminotransferase/4-amino-4-deoxychorismate lyase
LNNLNQSSIFNYAVVNGHRQPADQVQLSLFNKAIFASFGIYEAVKVDRGRPFYLEEHLHRLQRSAEMVDLGLKIDWQNLISWFELLNQIDPQATWRLFIIAIGAVEAAGQPMIAMRPEPLPTYPPHLYKKGATAILYEGQRALPACKSLNTLVNFLARRVATQQGALEGLLHHNGYLTEGARSNLFAVRQGELITPPASEVLSGITRDIIVQLMESTDYPVAETPLSTDLSLYEEFFITSTSMHVMPITRINGRSIGSGQVGPTTRMAMTQFETHYRQVMGE